MSRRDALLATLVAVIWGANFTVIDLGLTGIPPTLFAAIRFTAVLVPAVFLVPRPAVPLRVVLRVGAFLSLGQFALLYTALSMGMPPGLASLVLQAQVLLTVVFAAFRLHERPTRRQVLGVGIGVLGLVVVGLGRPDHVPLLGLMLVLAAAASWAVGNVISRAAGVRSGLSMTVWSALVVPVPMLLLALVIEGPTAVVDGLASFGWPAVLSTAYTAYLASLVGYGIWNSLLARRPAAEVVPFTLLVPPVGIATAWLVQHEQPSLAEIVGGALLMAGLAVTVLRGAYRAPGLDVRTAPAASASPAAATTEGDPR